MMKKMTAILLSAIERVGISCTQPLSSVIFLYTGICFMSIREAMITNEYILFFILM